MKCDSSESRGPQPRPAEARNGIRNVAFPAGCDPCKTLDIMNTIEKWLLRLLALMSLSSLAIHKITIHRAESFGARRLEAFDDAFATVVLILSAIFAVYRSVCIRRRSPRLWWRKCRRFAFWFGISIGIIPTVVIGFVKGDWTDIPDILCVAAASLLVSAAAHIRLRRMSCRP